uniref:Uncharacterized protein n=1 Tax=Trichobilharzia regenti TaxID=157069 RepID=A0AA85JL27_TRIRE|nr:unnamed protein product [Trichobilharzia regenti]
MVVQNVGDIQLEEEEEHVHHLQNQHNELNRIDEKISNPVKCNKSTQINAYSLHNQFKHVHTKNACESGEILFNDDVHSYRHYYYAKRKQQRQGQQLKKVKNDHLEIDKATSNNKQIQLPRQKSLHLKMNGLKLCLNNNPELKSTILNSHNNCKISDLDKTTGKIQIDQKFSSNSVKNNDEILGRTTVMSLSMTPPPIVTTPSSWTRHVKEKRRKDYKFKQKKLFQLDGNNDTCEACNKSRLAKRNSKILGEKFNYRIPLLKLEVTPTINETIVDLTLNIETNKSVNNAGRSSSRSGNNNNNSNNKDQTIAKPKMECDDDDDDETKSTDQCSLTSKSVKTRRNVTKKKNSKQSLRYALKSLLPAATRLTTWRLKQRIKSVIIKPFQRN